MAKKNLSAADRGGKSLSSTSTTLSSVHLDKNGGAGNKAPQPELTAEEKKEKFGKLFFYPKN